ncbi:hypothetical protein HOY82DRAFT_480792, partial [Tuber indicum]
SVPRNHLVKIGVSQPGRTKPAHLAHPGHDLLVAKGYCGDWLNASSGLLIRRPRSFGTFTASSWTRSSLPYPILLSAIGARFGGGHDICIGMKNL